ncbi:MAG: NUDIX domain-containing protein [bacterium]|nr:NUDIX domain-containing protein [bacterium]
MDILVGSYTEDGYQPIPSVRLTDDEYSRGLQCFVPACTDVVPIDTNRKVIYLAKRVSIPMTGWWWIGGGMMPHETKEEAVARNFQRETKLELPQDRFELIAVFDYRWKDRAQLPQEIGCHMLGYTFTIELTVAELGSVYANLEDREYKENTGLFAFDRERLVSEKVFPSILDLYDRVFS